MVPCGIGHICKDLCRIIRQRPLLIQGPTGVIIADPQKFSHIHSSFPRHRRIGFLAVTSVPAGKGSYERRKPMNNEIQQFDFKGASLRTLTDEAGEPWFVAKDVCDILELNNITEALRPLDDDEKTNFRNSEVAQSGGRAPIIISESGLYKLIMRSRKPEAKEFQRWVTHEVLPQIRKTGGYIPTSEPDSDEDIMARAVLVAQKTIKQKNQQIAEQQTRIVELEPKARFADAVAASDGTCLVGELAKMLLQNGIPVGQNRLFRLLRAEGYLGKSGSNRNMPTQRAMELGLFRIKETTVTHADGHTTVSRTPKVTGKGQRYFIDRYWGRAQPSLEAGV